MTLTKELHTIFPMHINKPNFFCKVHEDSQSTVKITTSDKFTPHIKHIALNYHHFCSYVKNGHIVINYCPTEDKKADLLTKPLADAAFFRLRHMLFVR
jgi:hypothetical protein